MAEGRRTVRKLLLLGRPVVLVLVVLCPGLRLLSGAQQPASEASDQLIEYPEALSEEKIRHLEKWVKGKDENRAPSSLRDIFGKETVAVPSSPPIVSPPPKSPEDPSGPVLKGFVFTRGGQGGSQPLAAIDYEGQMFLVDVGDTVGPYRVESVEAGDAVLLVEEATGEKLELILN
jgi:hypothetical protein